VLRVLYVQYTNPGAYPPLVRGAELLAEAGARVLMLGIRVPGTDALDVPRRDRIEVRRMPPAAAGWRLKAHYARYAAWVARTAAAFQPDWIYASDVLSAPVALAAAAITHARIVYHEHDAPSPGRESWTIRRCLAARRRLVRQADVVVTPNVARSEVLATSVGGGRQVLTVWNCPRRPAPALRRERTTGALRVLFRGSINRERLPTTVLEALARAPGEPTLDIAGYETAGSRGYVGELLARAHQLGIGARVRFLGAIPERDLARVSAESDIGLALMPVETRDENMRHMAGASNKVFEYLAHGMTPLVSDLAEWVSTFVAPGYAIACDPRDVRSIASTLSWAAAHRSALAAMGERGRARLLADWNYETQFAPVMSAMRGAAECTPSSAPRPEVQCAS
jgi:glycosyltransferase involved in cell wall biosynthesis